MTQQRTRRIKFGAHWTACVEEGAGGCLLWTGQIDKAGYGRRGGRLAHRLVYEMEVGPVPDALPLDHLCRVTRCVNPLHLEPVSQRENLLRSPLTFQGRNARKTHCPQGHPYDEANTYRPPRGGRICRACSRARRTAVQLSQETP